MGRTPLMSSRGRRRRNPGSSDLAATVCPARCPRGRRSHLQSADVALRTPAQHFGGAGGVGPAGGDVAGVAIGHRAGQVAAAGPLKACTSSFAAFGMMKRTVLDVMYNLSIVSILFILSGRRMVDVPGPAPGAQPMRMPP